MSDERDLIIAGGGPSGLAAAIEARQAALDYMGEPLSHATWQT